jgi:hypothetical protein
VHWPEGNVLIDARVNDDASRIPDYNAVVTIERIDATSRIRASAEGAP